MTYYSGYTLCVFPGDWTNKRNALPLSHRNIKAIVIKVKYTADYIIMHPYLYNSYFLFCLKLVLDWYNSTALYFFKMQLNKCLFLSLQFPVGQFNWVQMLIHSEEFRKSYTCYRIKPAVDWHCTDECDVRRRSDSFFGVFCRKVCVWIFCIGVFSRVTLFWSCWVSQEAACFQVIYEQEES